MQVLIVRMLTFVAKEELSVIAAADLDLDGAVPGAVYNSLLQASPTHRLCHLRRPFLNISRKHKKIYHYYIIVMRVS